MRCLRRVIPVFLLGMAAGCSPGAQQEKKIKDPPDLATLPFTAAAMPPSVPAPADGDALIKGAIASYQSLKTLHVTSESDTEMSMVGQANKSHQTAVLRLQTNPSKFFVQVRDTGFGTAEFIADGSSLVIYSGVQNAFVRYSGDRDFNRQYLRMTKQAPQLFSAIDFYQVKGTGVAGITDVRIVGEEKVRGRDTYVVTARFKDSFIRDFGEKVKVGDGMSPNGGTLKLWFTKSHLMLVKSNINIGWRGQVKDEKGRPVSVSPRISVEETVLDVQMNPTFHPDQFRYLPRTGTKEVFVEGASQ
jgi:hypothetical protein